MKIADKTKLYLSILGAAIGGGLIAGITYLYFNEYFWFVGPAAVLTFIYVLIINAVEIVRINKYTYQP